MESVLLDRFPDLPVAIFDRAADLLVEMCEISSPSGDEAGLERVADLLDRALTRCGLEVTRTLEDAGAGESAPVLMARFGADPRGELLLVGHLDTVLPAVPPSREGDRLLATGALDMKGGLVALVGALELMRSRGQDPPAGLTLVAVPDEEANGVISERAMARWGATARAALILEPGELLPDGGETIVAGRRGLAEWRLDVHGRPSHAGLAYWQGRSALAAAATWVADAAALSRRGDGATVNPGRMVAGDVDFVTALAANAALVGTPRRLNVIPDRALAEGEVRFLSQAEGDAVLATLRDAAEAVGREFSVRVEFAVGRRIPPVEPTGAGRPLVERAVALAARRGWALTVEADRGGVSFPNFLSRPDLPILDGLGPVGGGMHTRDEFLDLGSLARRITLLADLLTEL